MNKFSIMEKYLRSQEDLGVPNDLILDTKFDFPAIKPQEKPKPEEKIPVKENVGTTAPGRPQELAADQPPLPYSQQTESDKRDELAKLFYKCRACSACSLSKTRKNFVFGAGTAYTDIMAIGEAPGADEDEQGKPFVGAAGQLLTKMLAAINLERDKIFIANILKCRPPQNRKPNTAEIISCFPLLKKQIEIIKPKAILLLGGTAANTILKNEKSVGSLRGIVHYYENIPAVVTYHPSALLRDASWKKPAWDDLQRFERLLKELKIA